MTECIAGSETQVRGYGGKSPLLTRLGGGGTAESDHWGSIVHFRGFQLLFLEVGTHGPFDPHDLAISKRRPCFPPLLALPGALSSPLKHQHSFQIHRAGAGGEGGAGSRLHNQPALIPSDRMSPSASRQLSCVCIQRRKYDVLRNICWKRNFQTSQIYSNVKKNRSDGIGFK